MRIDTNFWRQENICEIPDELALKLLQEGIAKIKPEDLESELELTLRNIVRRELRSIMDQYSNQDFMKYVSSHFDKTDPASGSSEDLRGRDAE